MSADIKITDKQVADEVRQLLGGLVDLMNEARRRGIRVNFNINPKTPGGPFELMGCVIEKVGQL